MPLFILERHGLVSLALISRGVGSLVAPVRLAQAMQVVRVDFQPVARDLAVVAWSWCSKFLHRAKDLLLSVDAVILPRGHINFNLPSTFNNLHRAISDGDVRVGQELVTNIGGKEVLVQVNLRRRLVASISISIFVEIFLLAEVGGR